MGVRMRLHLRSDAQLSVPERLAAADIFRVLAGLLAVPLGSVILYRSVAAGAISPPAILVGVAFVAFGFYRSWFAFHRYQAFRAFRDNTP
jgi:hypothetical protein